MTEQLVIAAETDRDRVAAERFRAAAITLAQEGYEYDEVLNAGFAILTLLALDITTPGDVADRLRRSADFLEQTHGFRRTN